MADPPIRTRRRGKQRTRRNLTRDFGWAVRHRLGNEPEAELAKPFFTDQGSTGGLAELQSWARQEGLFSGQGNKKMEALQRRFRNWAAHPHRHVDMPMNAAGTVHEIAEVVNRLWGHWTPGGRLYPTPLDRAPFVLGWSNDPPGASTVRMDPIALAGFPHVSDNWTFIVVLAVRDDSLMDFDAGFELTSYPCDLLMGPGSGAEVVAWLASHKLPRDQATYLDRIFAVQQAGGKTFLPRRPAVALGLARERCDGSWYLIRADLPLAAFHHVRHGGGLEACQQGGPLAGCAVEEIWGGPWTGLEHQLRLIGADANPVEAASVRIPRRHPYPSDLSYLVAPKDYCPSSQPIPGHADTDGFHRYRS